MSLLVNLGSQIAPIIMLMQTCAGVLGVVYVGKALIEFYGASNPNASKYVSGANNFTVMGALVQLLIGSFLTAMSTLQLVGILSRTITDDYANSRFLSYAPTGSSFDEQRLAALATVLGLMQIVGMSAMIKGFTVANGVAHGTQKVGYGQALIWIFGGVIAWNFKWSTDVINCTFGFNVIGMFTPFGMKNACS